jgi:alkylation response protein AidB-like acyl-CoA dehydrogenase
MTIDFALTTEQTLLEQTVSAFAERGLRPAERSREEARALAEDTRRALDALGLEATLGEPGGEGAGALERCLALEPLGWGDAGAALAWLGPPLARALARRLGVPEAVAARVGFVELQERSDEPLAWLPIAAPTPVLLFSPDGAWRVAAVEGAIAPSLGLLAAGGLAVRAATTLAEGRADRAAAEHAQAELLLSGAALLAGVGRAALEHAQRYLQERVAFGKPLAQHQGLAFAFADVVMRLEAARWLLRAAAWLRDRADGESARRASDAEIARAWLECRDAALFATERGVQLLGGHGYMRAHPVEKWMRDARTLALIWGGEDLALELAARAEA